MLLELKILTTRSILTLLVQWTYDPFVSDCRIGEVRPGRTLAAQQLEEVEEMEG